MTRRIKSWLLPLAGIGFAGMATGAETQGFNFDTGNRLPSGWRADAGGGKPADWSVVPDPNAVSAPHVLSIVRINDTARGNFNLFWSPGFRFHDGSITVNIRANSGDVDQGGGLVWRALDKRNYYIARYNPLERNLRLYYVRHGTRQMLADAPGLTIGNNQWFALKVAHHDTRIQVWLNDKKLIEAADDTFPNPGGVGVWAKADAASSFDNLTVQHAKRTPVNEE